MTVFFCLAIVLLAAGLALTFFPGATKGKQSVTIRNEGSVVTVRSAGSSDITVSFDPGGVRNDTPPAPLLPGAEKAAEEEHTLLEEFTDPSTTMERKREIARTFNGLNCRFTLKEEHEPSAGSAASQTSSEDGSDAQGFDEGYEYPDPDEFE